MKKMKEMLIEESTNITLYFKQGNGRMVNVAKTEIFAGVPKHTITNVLAIGRPLPLKHVRAVVETLERVGYEPIYHWGLEVYMLPGRELRRTHPTNMV